MWPFKRKPGPEWLYLGRSKIEFVDENEKTLECTFIHFWADKNDTARRKYTQDKWSLSKLKSHSWFHTALMPWTEGGNLWTPIITPSEGFEEYTKKTCGYTRKGGHWVAPTKPLITDGNVIEFPTKGA